MLRSLSQAVYSPENVGHFGLAYEAYTHFTSPIRRYPDLLVHRAIKAVLEGRTYTPGNWSELGRHCSETERRADEASRDVDQLAQVLLHAGQDRRGFPGTVSAVTEFGIFVALDEIYVEGLVHISELGADYFHFDPPRHQLLGERTGQRFRLGDRMQRAASCAWTWNAARIDFVLAGAEEAQDCDPDDADPANVAAADSPGRQQERKRWRESASSSAFTRSRAASARIRRQRRGALRAGLRATTRACAT